MFFLAFLAFLSFGSRYVFNFCVCFSVYYSIFVFHVCSFVDSTCACLCIPAQTAIVFRQSETPIIPSLEFFMLFVMCFSFFVCLCIGFSYVFVAFLAFLSFASRYVYKFCVYFFLYFCCLCFFRFWRVHVHVCVYPHCRYLEPHTLSFNIEVT